MKSASVHGDSNDLNGSSKLRICKPREKIMAPKESDSIYNRVRRILESSRTGVARSVNTTQVEAYWLIGREIVEEEQKGQKRAGYGDTLLQNLAQRLKSGFGAGYSVHNLKFIRQFYLEYPALMSSRGIGYALRSQSVIGFPPANLQNRHAVRSESWKPGHLHPNLSWTHYRTLLRVDKPQARAFYEIEAIKNNWSARELERQINSLLFERLALSKDRKGLMKLATAGHAIQQPADVFKDPVVIEFLGLPESPRLVETDLEQAPHQQSAIVSVGTGQGFRGCQDG
jgi:predicted nuclease of restriction endonuclease-like (RecB) superfamily